MRRLLVPSLLGVLGLFTSSYVLLHTLGNPPTEQVRQGFSCPSTAKASPTDFQVLGTVEWSGGAVVLYKSLCLAKEGQSPVRRVFGYQLAKRNGMSWQFSGTGSYGSTAPPPEPEKLVEYGVGTPTKSNDDRYLIVYGQSLSSKVAAVEATFDNGKPVNTRVENGVFALVAPGASRICELRVIGSYNQILRRDDLTNLPQSEPARQKWFNRCWQSPIQS